MNPAERARRRALIRGVYPIIDDDPRWESPLRARIEALLKAGVSVLQLRFKHTVDRDALELARFAVERAHAHGALLIVNDRYDLADLAGADGVHLGADDLPPEALPAALASRQIVGLSTHTLAQVEASRERPVDYIGFGPVFGTQSKRSEYSARGVSMLRRAVQSAAVPVVAIGGIDAKNWAEVAASGAAAAAVISALAAVPDPERAARELEDRWNA